MQTVQELFKTMDFESVWATLDESGVFIEDDEKEVYQNHFEKIKSLDIVPSDDGRQWAAVLKKTPDFSDPSVEYYDISGLAEGSSQFYGIGMVGWNEAAGYLVSYDGYPVEHYVLALLYEISFYGDDDSEERKETEQLIEDINSGKVVGVSFATILKDLPREEYKNFEEYSAARKEKTNASNQNS